jgi:hypothetical protein
MRALRTNFDGITFRSKTKAQFAVFLDNEEIEYCYEPETYVLECVNSKNETKTLKYMPDFYLQDIDCYLEIKNYSSKRPLLQESLKAHLLAIESGKKCFIWFGPIRYNSNQNKGNMYCYNPDGTFEMFYKFTRCRKCGKIDITKDGLVENINCECEGKPKDVPNTIPFKSSFDYAKSFKFTI